MQLGNRRRLTKLLTTLVAWTGALAFLGEGERAWAGTQDCVEVNCGCTEDKHCAEHEESCSASVVLLGAIGSSSLNDDALVGINAGAHDPLRSGFTFQQAELSFGGKLDDWLRAEAHIVRSEEGLELEEAYLATTGRSAEVKLGQFYLPFGLQNRRHPHAWMFIDQNLAITRMFGGEGGRGEGLGVTWDARGGADDDDVTESNWRSTLYGAVHYADGEALASFRGEGGGGTPGVDPLPAEVDALVARYGDLTVGNRPFAARDGHGLIYTARWENAWNSNCSTRAQFGLSGAWGPNASSTTGTTRLYGADFSLKWQPKPECRWPFLLWENEYIARRYGAAAFVDNTDPVNPVNLPADTLKDWAWYSQLLYGFEPQWAAGLRIEQAGGSGDSIGGRASDSLRDDRTRISPLLSYWPEDNLHLRLQYNYDRAQHLGAGGTSGTASSYWLGAEWQLGGHTHHGASDEEFEVPGDVHDHEGHDHKHGENDHDHAEHEHDAADHEHSGHDHGHYHEH